MKENMHVYKYQRSHTTSHWSLKNRDQSKVVGQGGLFVSAKHKFPRQSSSTFFSQHNSTLRKLQQNQPNPHDRIQLETQHENSKEFALFSFEKKLREESVKSKTCIHLKTYVDGSKYKGYLKDPNIREGKGLYHYNNGDIFYGDWINDKLQGRGNYLYANGETYEGELKDGFKNGRGTQVHKDGRRYEGEWINNKKNGQGVFYNEEEEEIYEGAWIDNEKSGLGVQKYGYGAVYEGQFLANKKNGFGRLWFEDSGFVYSGGWVEDRAEGQGIIKYPNGDTYSGEVFAGQKYGKGIYKYADGSHTLSFEGTFESDKMIEGEVSFANGDKYIGQLQQSLKNGQGKIIYRN